MHAGRTSLPLVRVGFVQIEFVRVGTEQPTEDVHGARHRRCPRNVSVGLPLVVRRAGSRNRPAGPTLETVPVSVLWFRRDLRLADNPALLAAATAARDDSGGTGGTRGTVLPLFVLDPALFGPAGAPRRAYLLRSLRALDTAVGGSGWSLGGARGAEPPEGLVLRHGRPAEQVVRVVREVGAAEVHVAADYGRYGQNRDAEVEKALAEAGVALHRTGSPYAVAPGRVRKPDGTPYRVFTPYLRAWREHGWRQPAERPHGLSWARAGSDGWPEEPDLAGVTLPPAGEDAARARLDRFLDERLHDYATARNRPDQPGTSQLSPALKYGELHPRTVLAALAQRRGRGVESYRTELCWRDFYADVLFTAPESSWTSLNRRVGAIETDAGPDADARFGAWAEGRTGYPIVDAGMRQLAGTGWMHNRVRMVTASFLTKDLHLPWQRGAAHFMDRLVDGDLASNNHGWQWVAGTGTDAAPYFRVFNPVTQGRTFDPDGGYVRRWVPELAGVEGAAVHEPWKLPGGPPAGYPERIVDHAAERAEALARYERVR